MHIPPPPPTPSNGDCVFTSNIFLMAEVERRRERGVGLGCSRLGTGVEGGGCGWEREKDDLHRDPSPFLTPMKVSELAVFHFGRAGWIHWDSSAEGPAQVRRAEWLNTFPVWSAEPYKNHTKAKQSITRQFLNPCYFHLTTDLFWADLTQLG